MEQIIEEYGIGGILFVIGTGVVAGLGKAFNRQDARSTIAIHQNYGVGCDVVDPLLLSLIHISEPTRPY